MATGSATSPGSAAGSPPRRPRRRHRLAHPVLPLPPGATTATTSRTTSASSRVRRPGRPLALIAEAHELGCVVIDLVPNHTSDQHPWFRRRRSSRDAEHRDFYVWRDPAPDGGPPNNWVSHFGGPAWTLDEVTGQYYMHLFLPEQPDLNWAEPRVTRLRGHPDLVQAGRRRGPHRRRALAGRGPGLPGQPAAGRTRAGGCHLVGLRAFRPRPRPRSARGGGHLPGLATDRRRARCAAPR
jgi:hypothetical protein